MSKNTSKNTSATAPQISDLSLAAVRATHPDAPDTIVLIHGFWVTPRSWEGWIAHYEALGYKVIAPAYPGFEVEVEALNADTTPITDVTVPGIIAHLEDVVAKLDKPPILIGHSAGGTFTQVLLDHGYGAAGVAVNSAPTEGVKVLPWSQLKATFPILSKPGNRKQAVGLTLDQWKFNFANTFTDQEAERLYERYHVPASGPIFFESALANVTPGKQSAWVNYRNDDRAPLLFISGGEDHLMPPAIQRSNRRHYKSDTVTEIVQFDGYSHLLPAQEGWENIADYALGWALEHTLDAKTTDAAAGVRVAE